MPFGRHARPASPSRAISGADRAITDAIDMHVQAERAKDDDDDGQADALAPAG
jgi:hypothetical protein